ncbi:hypothetical protein M8C21_004816 [Ambrosia artemisiifolia]|uniref:Cytochrome P450 n=1 Tax=Ambrosia artemisiifolia TaxID=4212 RepID=A0AAD5GTD5_AMBAR|nr:hypothetical protein M8C21_004816 [Ambrosia artemisiifolia]
MDIKVFLTENSSSPILILSTLLLLLFIIKQTKSFFSHNIRNLPPGPPTLPIIGNLHQVGDKLHVSLYKLAQEYGPLISLKLGTKILVVASSPEAAMGILKTQDRSIVFDKDLLDLEEEHETFVGVKRSLLMILEYVSRVKDVGSFFPVFQRFDLQGIRKGGLKHVQEVFDYWKDMIDERRAHMGSSTWSSAQSKSFLDRLLENGFSDIRINQYVTELFVAGTNTTTTALIWALAEIVKNQDVMTKIKEEIKREIKSDKIKVSQLSKLPYLQACVKESLRLHPPVPFLLPRLAIETCEVMNYTIPKNAQIFVNIWAIGRDPKVWDDPLSFKPERFLDSNLDYKGQDFELLPFGSGKRICPSLPLGSKSIEFIIASLIHEFDCVLPDNEVPSKLDMEDKFQITLGKDKPLKLIFKHKHGSTKV